MTNKELEDNFDELLDAFTEQEPVHYPVETYSIPKEIKDKIPDYFYIAMAGELFSICGGWIFEYDDGNDVTNLFHLESTYGWNMAMFMSCKKLGMDWLYEYYDNLEWYDSDEFDGEIGEEIEKIIPTIDNDANSYYRHLLYELPKKENNT